jgi:N-lysine methyltransferase SETD6
MRAISDIPAGTEIFNTYGLLPRSALLRQYGYVADSYAPHDTAELPYDLVVQASGISAEKVKERVDFLQKHDENIVDSSYEIKSPKLYKSLLSLFEQDLLLLTSFLVVSDAQFEQLSAQQELPYIPRVGPHVAAALHRACMSKLQAYRTSIEEDEAEMKRLQLDNGMHLNQTLRRRYMAIQVRHGEKVILRDVGEMLEKVIQKDPPRKGTETESPNKRRKTQ